MGFEMLTQDRFRCRDGGKYGGLHLIHTQSKTRVISWKLMLTAPWINITEWISGRDCGNF